MQDIKIFRVDFTKMIRSVFCGALVSFLLMPALVFSEGKSRERYQHKEDAFFRCFEREYRPTAQQMKQIREVYRKSGEWRRLKSKMRQDRRAFREALKSDLSEKELRRRFNKMQRDKQEIKRERFEKMLKVRSILTSEQRQKMGVCREAHWKCSRRH